MLVHPTNIHSIKNKSIKMYFWPLQSHPTMLNPIKVPSRCSSPTAANSYNSTGLLKVGNHGDLEPQRFQNLELSQIIDSDGRPSSLKIYSRVPIDWEGRRKGKKREKTCSQLNLVIAQELKVTLITVSKPVITFNQLLLLPALGRCHSPHLMFRWNYWVAFCGQP